jgi:hypothetical protein
VNRKRRQTRERRIDADKFPAQTCGMANRKKKLTRPELDRQIRAIQSLCRQKPGEKSVVQELIEERRAEKEKEDR